MKRCRLLTLLVGISMILFLVTIPFMSACGTKEEAPGPGLTPGPTPTITEVKTMKIGLLGSFTGSYAPYGTPARQAAVLRKDMINEAGGFTVNGQKYEFELVEYDDRTDPKRTVAGLNMMADQHGIQWIVGPMTSQCTLAAQPISEARHIALVSAAASTVLVRPGIKWFWAASGIVGIRAAACWPYYINQMKIKSVSIITENYAYALSMREDGIGQIKKLGGCQIVADEMFESDTTDFSTIIARIRQPNPDALYICASPAKGILVTKQAYEAGWHVQIISLTELISDDNFKVNGKAANGIMGMGGLDYYAYKNGVVPQEVQDRMKVNTQWYFEVCDRFIERHGDFNVRSAIGYGTYLQGFMEGFVRSGTVTDMDKFMSVFRTMEFDSPAQKFKVLPNQLWTTFIPLSVYWESTKADKYTLLSINYHTDDMMQNWEAIIVTPYKTIDELRKERGY